MGGYQPGRDSELDQAAQLVPKMYDVMRQAPSDPACAEPFQELLAVIKSAIG
jgi:flagellum-specific ATP synthase